MFANRSVMNVFFL